MLKCLRNLLEISRFYHHDLFVQDNESMSSFGVMRRSVLGNENVYAKFDESADGGEK